MLENLPALVLGPKWQVVGDGFREIIVWIGSFLQIWWWIFLPFIFYILLRHLYLWSIKHKWEEEQKYEIVEIKIPEELKRPMKVMEQVFSHLWSLYKKPKFKDKWLKGKGYQHFSVEIIGIGGEIHFLVRFPQDLEDTVKSIFYSQYPDLELHPVKDYTQRVPQKMPAPHWKMWGAEFSLLKKDYYPIKTYQQFFEQVPEIKEEKKIDPLFSLLEGLTTLKEGEQMWIQLVCAPISDKENNWISRGQQKIEEIVAGAKKKKKRKTMLRELLDLFIFNVFPESGQEGAEEEKKQFTRLNPPARAEVEAIDNKISKSGFEVFLRTVYLGKEDVFFSPRATIPINFFAGLSTEKYNGFKPSGRTSTDFSFLEDLRVYTKSREFFEQYVKRSRPDFPHSEESFILNAEELASIFHFPSKGGVISAGLERIKSKKGRPPTDLPVE